MEERMDVMTDNQWDGMIKMFMMIAKRCKSTDEVLSELRMLVRDKKEADAIIEGKREYEGKKE